MEGLQYYRLLNEQENLRGRMRMANTYNSEKEHAHNKREFRKARNRLMAFKKGGL